jgi:O-antigen ligase
MHEVSRTELAWPRWSMGAIVAAGVGFAVLAGAALGQGTRGTLVPLGAIVGLAAIVAALVRPFSGYLVLAASSVMLILVLLPTGHGVNLFDLLLPAVLIASVCGVARNETLRREAWEQSEAQRSVLRDRRRFARAAIAFFALAFVSVIPMVLDGRTTYATDSIFSLVRATQGLALFPLGLWLLRDERRVRQTMDAMLTAMVVLLAVNIAYESTVGIQRGGMSWFINNPYWPIADPNECAAGMLLVLAIVLARHAERPHWRYWVLGGLAVAMLILSQSRSGLLAFGTFGLLRLRGVRWGWVALAALVLAMLVPLVPHEYWVRVANTIAFKKGTFETYTSMIRFMTWKTALNVFAHHPIFGVGYLGLESVSTHYNEMQVRVGAESYILEMAADLGIVGLALLGTVIAFLIRLGRTIRRRTPPGSLAHAMASMHTALVLSLLTASLTGANFIGFTGLGQLALWTVLMERSARAALRRSPAGPPPGTASA